MQEEVNDSKTFDVQYSIRLPEDLATEINARAAAEGVKPSTWIRNCITSAIKQKNELNADILRTPLLMLLKRDKSVRATIKDITGENEKLPEEAKLRKKCDELTTSMSGILYRLKQRKAILESFHERLPEADEKIKELSQDFDMLKEVSQGSNDSPACKKMLEKVLKKLEHEKLGRREMELSIQRIESSIHQDEILVEDMKREKVETMLKLKSLEDQRGTVQRSRDEL